MFLLFRGFYFFSLVRNLMGFSGFYCFLLFFVFFIFLFTRVPYFYGMGGFFSYLFFIVGPLFFSLFLSRLTFGGVSLFFSSLVPVGTPLWISPLVVMAESASYVVRPVVLLLRPFLNISIGSLGGVALSSFFFYSSGVLFLCFVLFFYEVFVAVVHWFIVCNILSFSKDH